MENPQRTMAPTTSGNTKESFMGTLFLAVLVLLVLRTLPIWPHSKNWGFRPSAGVGLVFAGVAVLLFLGYIPR